MAEDRKRQEYGSYSSDHASLELYEDIKKLVELSYVEKTRVTYDELLFEMRRWWCRHYNRPYKDPLLDTYTFEELAFEYWDIRGEPERKAEAVAATTEMPQEEHDWAAEEEARELAEALAAEEEAKSLSDGQAELENDTITEEAAADEAWAAKHEPKVLKNPSAEEVDSEDGDISASFEG